VRLTTTFGGSKSTRKNIKQYADRIGFAMDDAVELIGEAVQEQAKHLILNAPATGRIYQRDNPPRIHQASAPGEPPANDTGKLYNSITLRMVKINQYASAAVVGTALDYGIELERFGPQMNGQTRPFLRPAVVQVEQRVGAILQSAWNKNRL
jgi:hypothetical protein